MSHYVIYVHTYRYTLDRGIKPATVLLPPQVITDVERLPAGRSEADLLKRFKKQTIDGAKRILLLHQKCY